MLRFLDGFDYYSSIAYNYSDTGGTLTLGSSYARVAGGQGLLIGLNGYIGKTFSGLDTWIVGTAFKIPTGQAAAETPIFSFLENSTTHCSLWYLVDGSLAMKSGATGAIISQVAAGITVGNWYYIQCRVKINDTTGTIDIKVNNTLVLSASNKDTKNGGTTGLVNIVRLGGGGGMNRYVDDFYIADTTGAYNNNFLNDVVVKTSWVNGNGNQNDFTPSNGGSNYTNVDETLADTSDYTESDTVGAKEFYTFSNITLPSGSILAVKANLLASKSAPGSRDLGIRVRINSSEYNYGTFSPSYPNSQIAAVIMETNPSTSATWTIGQINDISSNRLEVGGVIV